MRASKISLDANALVNNLNVVKRCAPNAKVVAMVKANAYGCGLQFAVETLAGRVSLFGVACIEEALAIRALGCNDEILLLEGFFDANELALIQQNNMVITIHTHHQLQSLLNTPLKHKQKVWLKVDTGMHRLGFNPDEVSSLYAKLRGCAWIDDDIVVMTHFSSADELQNPKTATQIALMNHCTQAIGAQHSPLTSMANSAAIIAWPQAHSDYIRPGIMLYGSSPIASLSAAELGLKPVMHFHSDVIAMREIASGEAVGYGEIWRAQRKSRIAVVAVGYGDGYPRVIEPNTPVYLNGAHAPIVGRISMDMLTIDVTEVAGVTIGTPVELWGRHVAIDRIAASANTIAYELLCKVTARVR